MRARDAGAWALEREALTKRALASEAKAAHLDEELDAAYKELAAARDELAETRTAAADALAGEKLAYTSRLSELRKDAMESKRRADEALGEDGLERRGDEVGLDAHVHEARAGAGGVVRVQRGEDEVAGERRLHRDLRGLGVADLAESDDAISASGSVTGEVAGVEQSEPRGGGFGSPGMQQVWPLRPGQLPVPPPPATA